MKLLAALIMTIGLALGLIASLTAYVPKLDAISPEDQLTLNAPAGIDPSYDEADPNPPGPRIDPRSQPEPVVLTAELIEQLKEDGETRVRVKEFSIGRWQHWWLFVLACAGLLSGAVMMRIASRRGLEERVREEDADAVSPPELLNTAYARLEKLQSDVDREPDDHASMKRMIATIDSIRDEQFDQFVSAKQSLVGRYAMAGYAQLMDRFAAAERQVNRAWSASADGIYEEAVECLGQGIVLLAEAIRYIDEAAPRETGGFAEALTPEPMDRESQIREGEPPRGHDHDRPLS